MLESVRCPSCLTHYGLRPERVRPGVRKARCLKCKDVFKIEEAVQRLLQPQLPLESIPVPLENEPPLASDHGILAEPAAAGFQSGFGFETGSFSPGATTLDVPPLDLLASLPPVEAVAPRAEPVSQRLEAPSSEVGASEAEHVSKIGSLPEPTTTLSLGELDFAEDDLLEKTLVTEPPVAEATPEHREDPAELEGGDVPPGTYASARDAINKLLGGLPPAPSHGESIRSTHSPSSSSMDVEATLSALENTLGGVHPADLGVAPILPASPAPVELPLGKTMKVPLAEIQAALQAGIERAPAPSQAASSEATVAIRNPFAGLTPGTLPQDPKVLAVDAEAAQDPNLFKLQVGSETYTNVTMENMVAWIEQGRLLEWHLVARQFSENWIEAIKVPSLRSVFERMRRGQSPMTTPTESLLPPAADIVPAKRSLFGGLFKH